MAAAQARADAMIAKPEADGRAAQPEAAQFMAGQASASVGSPRAAPPLARSTRRAADPPWATSFKQAFEGFRDSVGETFDDRRGIIDPGPGADLNRPPAELEDDGASATASRRRARRARSGRARALPRAEPGRDRVHALRRTGGTQLEDVVARLGAGRARPSASSASTACPTASTRTRTARTRPTSNGRSPTRPGALAPAYRRGAHAAFGREDHWVARRPRRAGRARRGRRGAFCARAGLQPEDCFGLTRLLHIRGSDGEDGESWSGAHRGRAGVQPPVDARSARARGDDGRGAAPAARPPLRSTSRSSTGRRSPRGSRPDRMGPPRCPSPLPAPPEHLAGAADRLPRDRRRAPRGHLRRADHARRTATGSPTSRWRAAARTSRRSRSCRAPTAPRAGACRRPQHIVLAYRDRAEYEEGRARWRAYQQGGAAGAARPPAAACGAPIEVDDHPPPSFLSEVFDMFNPLDPCTTSRRCSTATSGRASGRTAGRSTPRSLSKKSARPVRTIRGAGAPPEGLPITPLWASPSCVALHPRLDHPGRAACSSTDS